MLSHRTAITRIARRLCVCQIVLGFVLAAHGADNIQARADSIARKQLDAFGKGYHASIDRQRHIVYVSALDDHHLKRTRDLLAAFTDAQRRTLLKTPLPWNVAIILPTVEDYKNLQPKDKYVGYYQPQKHMLVSIDRGSVLLHEFTHALHHADAASSRQVHPLWVQEGLATLFESARITPSGLVPRVDTRLITLKKALREKKTIPLERLLAMGSKDFLAEADLTYAESRYLMLYLHEKGRLQSWYDQFKRTYVDDPTGKKALVQALGNRLFQIEPAWEEWAGKLKLPTARRGDGESRLGVEVKDTSAGVELVKLLPGGSAKRTGRLRAGDVFEKLNGQTIRNTADFVAAVRKAGALRTVRIEVRRRGRSMTILQPLGKVNRRDEK